MEQALSPGSSSGNLVRKRSIEDFAMRKQIGEGSYSTVMLAVEAGTGREYAVKILDKRHIIKEKKVKYVNVEKAVLNRTNHPFVIRLFYTFQDQTSLYFVLDLAPNGDLLDWIKRAGPFDLATTRFYSAEILAAIDYLHSVNVIHRDIKPENILMDAAMHIKLTDFGTAKILDEGNSLTVDDQPDSGRTRSFVGTAEYVSPELLTNKAAGKPSDLWALGCIIFQMLAGKPPFKGPNEYQTFQRITKLEYQFPESFPEVPKDLVRKLLVLDPAQRLTVASMKAHPFFASVDWEGLPNATPPKLVAHAPPSPDRYGDSDIPITPSRDPFREGFHSPTDAIKPERQLQLEEQRRSSKWAPFLQPNELIVLAGPVNKRKNMFYKRRILVLTDRPRLFYVDEEKNEVKGEIPWDKGMRPELKNAKQFLVHTSARTFIMEDLQGDASKWVDMIAGLLATNPPAD